MRRNLQSKFNLLAVTLIVFSLLMLPMFNQVKADTRGSLKEAKNTWLSKMFREVSQDFKPRNLEDTEVEDYWADQVKENNEDCRNDPNNPKCDANGDLDGDGMSNGDEVRAGRNPACNEDTEPNPGYCAGKDKFNVTEPDPVVAKIERLLVFNSTWNFSQCGQSPLATQCGPARPFPVQGANITMIEMWLNVTGFTGTSYSLRINGPGNEQLIIYTSQFGAQGDARNIRRSTSEPSDPGTYSAQLTFPNGGAQSGTWQIEVYAHVVR